MIRNQENVQKHKKRKQRNKMGALTIKEKLLLFQDYAEKENFSKKRIENEIESFLTQMWKFNSIHNFHLKGWFGNMLKIRIHHSLKRENIHLIFPHIDKYKKDPIKAYDRAMKGI